MVTSKKAKIDRAELAHALRIGGTVEQICRYFGCERREAVRAIGQLKPPEAAKAE